MEMVIRSAIWEMLAMGYSSKDIKDGFECVNLIELIDDVEEDYQEELDNENN